MHFISVALLPFALVGFVSAAPFDRRAEFTKQNGIDAQNLQASFASLTADSPCTDNQQACINGQFAKCANGKFSLQPCNTGLTCLVLPLVNSPGTSITCDTDVDQQARIATALAGRSADVKLEIRDLNVPPACSGLNRRSSAMSIAKRIAQSDLGTVAQSWQDLCFKSGGDITTNDPCVKLAGIDGINALLGAADPCAQQANGDAMIDFANSPGITNKQALIDNAIAFVKHPRNSLTQNGPNGDVVAPSTPFCGKAPKNKELNGVSHAQLAGTSRGIFGSPKIALFAFGEPGSCPFGKTPKVDTCTCV